MANFCRSCGAALKPDAKFCTSCGAAVAMPPAPSAAPIAPVKPVSAVAAATDVAAGDTATTGSFTEDFGRRRKLTVIALVVAGVAVLAVALLLVRFHETPTGPTTASGEHKAPPAVKVSGDPIAIVAARWEHYTNARYGVMIDYPADLFAIQPPPPDNAGREFTAEKAGARFFVYSHANALDFSIAELQAEDVLDIGDAAAAKTSGEDWYQVVATRDADTILRRVLLSEGNAMVHRLEIAFPKAAAAAFAPIVARMVKSFRVDPSIPEKAAVDPAPRSPPAVAPEPPSSGGSPAVQSPPSSPGGFTYHSIDSIGQGLRLAGAKSMVGFAADVPSDWGIATGVDRDSLFFVGHDPSYGGDIVLSVAVELRGPDETLASKVDQMKAGLDGHTRENVSQGAARIGLHPAILVVIPMGEFRKTVAYIEKDDHFYVVQLHAPTRLYGKYSPVLERALSSMAFAE